MNNFDKREDRPGDNHPVCPERRESHNKAATKEKRIIYLSIAAFIIGMIFVWLAINEK